MSSPIFYLFLWLENSQNTDILKLQALVVPACAHVAHEFRTGKQ